MATYIGAVAHAQIILYTGRNSGWLCNPAPALVREQNVPCSTYFNSHRFQNRYMAEMMHQFQENNETGFMMSDLNRCFAMYRCIAQSYYIYIMHSFEFTFYAYFWENSLHRKCKSIVHVKDFWISVLVFIFDCQKILIWYRKPLIFFKITTQLVWRDQHKTFVYIMEL